MVALSFGLALAAPSSALAGDGAHPFHKHATQMSHATALAPARAVAPALPAIETDGLSRNLDDCVRYGCIGSN